MIKFLKRYVLFFFLGFGLISLNAQHYWNIKTLGTAQINFTDFETAVNNQAIVYLPLPDSGFIPFTFVDASVLPISLSEKYKIKAFQGTCTLDNKTNATLTIFENKLYASITFHDKKVNISPENTIDYKVEWVTSREDEHLCFSEKTEEFIPQAALRTSAGVTTTQIKNYTIAIATTGEYTTYHGGTVAKTLAAITTTLNRVNSIYNRDLSINLVLHPKTDLLIYLNKDTDPFNNSNANAILNAAQGVFDAKLGNSTYDLGHIFSTGAGGLADIYTVCTKVQASGVTGTSNPIGDAYDVDFVAHEIGHQFGGDHTFNGIKNSCAGNLGTARYEIGSGSTVMAYAGICGTDNLQSNSDAYFHVKSIEQIKEYLTLGPGKNCGYFNTEINTAPEIISQTASGYTIPKSTPFILDGKAKDFNNDVLTYNWEQVDIGPSAELNSPSGNAPLFRSFSPSTISERYFPKFSSILSATNSIGEILPNYARSMKFSFNVRDQKGGISSGETAIIVSNLSGPFVVNSPKNAEIYDGGTEISVKWDVAGTNVLPVNCQKVMVLLATNGLDFKDTLLLSTPNDGEEMVKLPYKTASTCKIMVKALEHIFYQVSDGLFSIKNPTNATYVPEVTLDKNFICGSNDSIKIKINAQVFGNFEPPISYILNLNNTSIVSDKTVNTFAYDGSDQVIIKLKSSEVNQEIDLIFSFTAAGITREISKSIVVYTASLPQIASPISPLENELLVSKKPVFTWDSEDFVQNTIVLNEGLSLVQNSGVLNEKTFNSTALLKSNTLYNWTITSTNSCGSSSSEKFNFTTGDDTCFIVSSLDLPLYLSNGQAIFEDQIYVSGKGIITGISIENLKGTHEWTSDLSFDFIDPYDNSYSLFTDVCDGGAGSNFDLGLSDNASNFAPCPPVGGTFKPLESFEKIIGQDSKGFWGLSIQDYFPDEDEGVLRSWSIKFCMDKRTFNGAPSLILNTPSKIISGGIDTITSANLIAWDDLTQKTKITYKLTSISPNLVMVLNNKAITVGQTFTQEDIQNNLLAVQMNDTAPLSTISFVLINTRGEISDTLSHNFIWNGIISSNEDLVLTQKYFVSPNPIKENLKLSNDYIGNVAVFDVLGKLIYQGIYNDNLPLELEKGIYLLKLDNGQVLRFEK